MKVHVAFSPAGAPVGVVVHVLRAPSATAPALTAGIRRVPGAAEVVRA